MYKNNLISMLKTFSPKEMKEFRAFISSPFYNTNENVSVLFDILKKYYPDFKSRQLDKKKIFSKIYSGEKYKDSKMRLLIFYLNEAAETFLLNKNLYEDGLTHNVHLLRELKKRNLPVSFERAINESNKKLNEVKIKDSDYLMNKFNVDILYQNYLHNFPNYVYNTENVVDNPADTFSNLTSYYNLIAFEQYEMLRSANYLFEKNFKLEPFEKIINDFDIRNYSDYPEILCRYYLCMLWVKPEDESYFYELKKLLENNKDKISIGALNASSVGLENYCTIKIKAGNKKFLRGLFESYKNDLEYKYYLEDGFITDIFYRNMVVVSSALEEFEWAESFIRKYKDNLQKEIRDEVYNYSMAYLETELKNYEKSLSYISVIKTNNVYLKVAIRTLESRIFYELGWHDQLNSLVDASKHFLKSNKFLSSLQKEFYSGFFKTIYKINQYKISENNNKLVALKSEIESNNNIHAKTWLLEKIDEHK